MQKKILGWSFFLTTLCLVSPCLAQEVQDPVVVEIVAERFVFTPSRVTVSQGSTIEFRLKSEDTSHGFLIVGTDIDVIIPKRRQGEAKVTFVADTPGSFRFECSKLCGAGHHFMRGTIEVSSTVTNKASKPDTDVGRQQ